MAHLTLILAAFALETQPRLATMRTAPSVRIIFPPPAFAALKSQAPKCPTPPLANATTMRDDPRETDDDRETELRGSGARMTSRIVKPGARREPHGDPQGYRSQIVRNGLFSMTRSDR